MTAYRYEKTDAFTAPGSLGNPAACLYLREEQQLSDRQMQEIATAHKGFVSEVVYCREVDQNTFALHYFSSECEVAFCGHGTIACMYSLIANDLELQTQHEITIFTQTKGNLTVYNRISEQNAVYISAPEPIYLPVPVSTRKIAEKLQINETVISKSYPIDFVDAGNRTLIVPILKFEDEVNISPDEQVLKKFTGENEIDVIAIFCMDVQDKTHFAHTRIFAAKYGYLEDPATGSGNSAFGYYLIRNNLWRGDSIAIEQGGNDCAFNTVRLIYQDGRVLFGGSATTRIRGEYLLDEGLVK